MCVYVDRTASVSVRAHARGFIFICVCTSVYSSVCLTVCLRACVCVSMCVCVRGIHLLQPRSFVSVVNRKQ